MDSSKSVLEAVVPVNDRLRIEESVVVTEKEFVEVVNNYLYIPVTSFDVRKIEQPRYKFIRSLPEARPILSKVNLDESADQSSEAMKQAGEDGIVISSDSNSESDSDLFLDSGCPSPWYINEL